MVHDSDDRQQMNVEEAALIAAQARDRARRELQYNHPAVFTAWGVIYLFVYGLIWLSVRGQRPYAGPTTAAVAIVFVVVIVAVIATIAILAKAFEGVGGQSAVRRRIFAVSLALGYAGVYTLEGALAHAGAHPPVIAVMGASGPVLVTGLVYLVSAAADFDWPVFFLGAWLMVAAAGSGFAGPVGVWAVNGLAGGLGWLVAAAVTGRQRRS